MNAPPAIVRHLARTLGGDDPDALLAVTLACAATQAGHVCADLDADTAWSHAHIPMDEAARAAFRARLPTLGIVGDDTAWTPLVWDSRRLYLRRYRDYERRVADDLRHRAGRSLPPDPALIARCDALFPDPGQRQAARVAITRGLCLITGGPGTGKTHTLARIIALLREQDPTRAIGLAAPTGKAAARMADALTAADVTLPRHGAMTLHRLLGMRADGRCRHDRDRPLPLDVLVVDEASMIGLALMARLIDALPPTARLLLLGDKDQLAAVEAGAVLSDLCASDALAPCLAPLTTSFRFGGAIAELAAALRAGETERALAALRAHSDDLVWDTRIDADGACLAAARNGYAPFMDAVRSGHPPDVLFERFSAFRVLCARRQEVEAMNRALSAGETLFPGLPVMVTQNDALLRVFNGDIGLALHDPADGELKACFLQEGTCRWIAFARLPRWEAAWAMTVHKSQGSEFAHVLLVLPETDSPVLTRELVYTGITRARARVSLWASEAALRAAVGRRAERMSGLQDNLDQRPC